MTKHHLQRLVSECINRATGLTDDDVYMLDEELNSLGIDNDFDLYELTADLEDELGIELDEAWMRSLPVNPTVGDVVDLTHIAYLAQKARGTDSL